MYLSMPSNCSAIRCTICCSKEKGIKLHNPERKRLWVQAKRANWQPKEHSRTCSAHLISGKQPSINNDNNNESTEC